MVQLKKKATNQTKNLSHISNKWKTIMLTREPADD